MWTWGWAIIRNLQFTFAQNGHTIETGNDFKILDYDGLAASDYETMSVASPFLQGDTVISQRVLPRYVTATVDCHVENRDFVLRFFKPQADGQLTVAFNDVRRRIGYKVDGFRIIPCNVHFDLMTFTVRLRCPEPYFRHMSDFGQDIAALTALEIFPFVWETETLWFPDYRQFDTSTLIRNQGDTAIGLRIDLLSRGSVRNPFFVMGDGQRMEIFTDMDIGDVLSLNTKPRHKSVFLNGKNIIHKVGRDGVFISLQPGENTLTYGAEIGLQHLEVRLFFTPLYLGI